MKKRKGIIRFLTIFILTFILMEVIEFCLNYFFGFDISKLKWGWIGFGIIWGFKYHIFCCLIPTIWAGYKCSHKKCEHDYCEHDEE